MKILGEPQVTALEFDMKGSDIRGMKIRYEQDERPILEWAKHLRDAGAHRRPGRNKRYVGSIAPVEYHSLMVEFQAKHGGKPGDKGWDKAFNTFCVKRLKSGDYAKLRGV